MRALLPILLSLTACAPSHPNNDDNVFAGALDDANAAMNADAESPGRGPIDSYVETTPPANPPGWVDRLADDAREAASAQELERCRRQPCPTAPLPPVVASNRTREDDRSMRDLADHMKQEELEARVRRLEIDQELERTRK